MRIGIWMCLSALLGASVTGGAEHDGAAVWNQATRLELIQRDGAAVGVALKSGGQTLGEITFGPNGGWKAKRQEIKRDGQTATVRFVGFDAAETGGAPRLARDSFIEFVLHGDAPFPRVRFSIGFEAFDENAWQSALSPPAPLYYLVCRVASPKMFYLGGGLIPAPEFEPYPLTRQGVMSGNWSARWSYAAPMAALAVPAFGLWNPDAKLFVGYDFGVARHTDRSDKHIASAYCAGEGKHQGDVFCLVHPYQARWVDLTYPKTPSRVESHFELVYSPDLPSHADPNEFVLTRFVRDHADLLVPAPAMNDLTWIRDPGKAQLPPTIQRDSGASLIHKSGPHYLEGAFVERGALMLGTTFPADGVRKIYQQKNRAAIQRLREDIAYLKERAIWKDIGGDKCCLWKHPAEGRFKDRWGGDDCAGVYHKSAWQIGAAMMVVYANEKDESLLPFVDGVFNWTKHFLYTRNGVCDLPWAMFCHIGLAAGENFMLTYRQVFRDDPVRRKNLDEALRLARMCAYKSTWFFLADPDESDGMDPTFLGQAVMDKRWQGRVTWNECGWIPRTAIPLYCETGDPFLKYLVRGAAEAFFVGYREDGGITENVEIFGESDPKGRRTAGTAGITNGAQMRRWAEPAGASPVRICIGEKAAIAFCKDTFDYDVADYAYRPEMNCRFRLAARPGAKQEPIDITLTAAFRDLRARPIRLNGLPLPPDRIEFNEFTDGEDAYIRQVRPNDVIEVGDATGAPHAPPDPLPYRTLPAETETGVGDFHTVNLTMSCNEQLEMRFGEPDTWYGWLYGLKWREGIPYYFLAPELNGGRACVKGNAAQPAAVAFKAAPHVFAVFGVQGEKVAPPTEIARVRLIGRDGKLTDAPVTSYRWLDVNCDFPLRKFNAYVAMLSGPKGQPLVGLQVLEGRLFALTTLSKNEELASRLRAQFDDAAWLATANAQRGRYPSARQKLDDGPKWDDGKSAHRLVLDVTPSDDMPLPVLRIPLDLNLLCKQVDAAPVPLPCRVRCMDQSDRRAVDVPAQFDLFGDGRGVLVIVPPKDLKAKQTRRYAAYFEPSASPSAVPALDGSSATVSSGRGGVRFVFKLSAGDGGPRLTDLRFDLNGDGEFAEPNVLGKTGFSGGFGCLTAVHDPHFWFNFGQFQPEPARARVVCSGPASTTLVVENLHLFGLGGPLEFKGRGDRVFPIGRKGVARWFFRTYAGRPLLDQWVEWQMDDADTGWTRPLQVRYGLASFDPQAATVAGKPGEPACAKDFAVVAIAEEEQRLSPVAEYTKDGPVVQVLLDRATRPGRYASNFWRVGPTGAAVKPSAGSVEVYALERKEAERIVRSSPKPVRGDAVSTLDAPVVQPGPEPPLPGTLNWDTSFETPKDYWNLSEDAAWAAQAARTGKLGALLEVSAEKGKKLALISTSDRVNREMALEPNAAYRLTFWARCASEKGLLRANLYWGPGYDFPQERIELPGDGKWHRYELTLRTGNFPPPPPAGKVFVAPSRIFPSLRLWCISDEQVVHVDDVCLTAAK